MSEKEIKHWALTPYATSSPALVQVAGKQLAIAAQLKEDIERGRLVAILKRISALEAVSFLSKSQTIDDDLIGSFVDHWHWYYLSGNKILSWSAELIDRYADRWDWSPISNNEALPWSHELIKRYKDRLPWKIFSARRFLPWSLDLIECYKDHWNWEAISQGHGLPWSPELIERYEDRWDWWLLSWNESLPWSRELIERFRDRWDWGGAGKVYRIAFRKALRERPFAGLAKLTEDSPGSRSNMPGLSGNKSLPWSLELIKQCEDRWDWWWLSRNESLPWSPELIDRYMARWDWGGATGLLGLG